MGGIRVVMVTDVVQTFVLLGGALATLLATLGLALLAWFRTFPGMLAVGQSIDQNADQLFPRYVAWCVGVVVVLLSTVVRAVSGNLLEIAFKVTNLLVAPLFGLFFMALFVPWATSFGTFVGAAFGLARVVSINDWKDFTGEAGISFLWAIPLGLTVQVTAGSLASLLSISRRRPPDDTSP